MILNPIDTALNILEKVYGEADIVAHAREQLAVLREAAQQKFAPDATPAERLRGEVWATDEELPTGV
jgi:hypothetical protein